MTIRPKFSRFVYLNFCTHTHDHIRFILVVAVGFWVHSRVRLWSTKRMCSSRTQVTTTTETTERRRAQDEKSVRVCVCVCFSRSRAPCTLLYVNNVNPLDCARRDQIQLLFIIYSRLCVCVYVFYFFFISFTSRLYTSLQSFPPCILLVSLVFNYCWRRRSLYMYIFIYVHRIRGPSYVCEYNDFLTWTPPHPFTSYFHEYHLNNDDNVFVKKFQNL